MNKETLVLIDEIGAGTDPEEGASLAISILDFCVKRCQDHGYNALSWIKTLRLQPSSYYKCLNGIWFEDFVTNLSLQIGIPGHSNAFAIARRLGMREDVVKMRKLNVRRRFRH